MIKNRKFRFVFLLFGLILLSNSCQKSADDESRFTGNLFTENIRSTDPRTAEEERLGFKIPPGFEIQLFASEPDIDKPINMNFDAQGRMWVTQSFEYPFPSPLGSKSTDRLTIVEDTDHDGKADRFTKVSDSLNIPIGVLPLNEGVIAFSVPNVYKFSDSNNDGKPEQAKILLGPFGFQDTHGMVSNFMRGYDGWVHACHGFTNYSVIAGSDGDSIKLVSGNTFRFRLDGSRVEQMTFGQVNPFGLAYDERGYIYSTDSHSSPLYQLIQGADYPHFSKPEIMAFGPDMKPLENEATALCGIAYYGDNQFPKEFQSNFFIGDALISRVHRYSWTNKGSSPVGQSETDFIKSEDPWFRPVNVKLGPDGALYVADFYNAIIGHYEVPLGHPKRDKQRGRIWRITYKGQHHDVPNLMTASQDDLLTQLNADNITTRMAASDQLTDRIGNSAIATVTALLNKSSATNKQYIHGLWILFRLEGMNDDILKKAIAHSDPLIRLHALRILREWKPGSAVYHALVNDALQDQDPHVQRAAVELIMGYIEMNSVKSTLSVLKNTPVTDRHLVYTAKLCLRNLLRNDPLMTQVSAMEWDEQDAGFIAGTLVDVNSAAAAEFLASYINKYNFPKEKTSLAYQQIARYLPLSQMDLFIKQTKDKKVDIDLGFQIFNGIKQGLAQRGENKKDSQLRPWGTEIAEGILKKYPADSIKVSDQVFQQQNNAIQLAGEYNVITLTPVLKSYLEKHTNSELRSNALRSLLKIGQDKSVVELAGKMITSDSSSLDLKKRLIGILGETPSPAINQVLLEIKNPPADLEVSIVSALAGSPEGKDLVFSQIKNGGFKTRSLVDPRVEERILLKASPKQQKEYESLIANIEPISTERQNLINERLLSFKTFKASNTQLDSGARLFNINCGICHRKLTNSGIGPQLHGIGKRGADAIAEKILDPNRNITEAFRNYTIKLKDGRILTGLFRSDQGAVVVFGDLTGKEFSIPRKDIVEQKPSRYTIMPDHFGSTLNQHEFDMLVSYLLTW